jgi:P-type conjugative transfer protein TrbJ
MKMKIKSRNLAAKIALSLAVGQLSIPANAGVPVGDGAVFGTTGADAVSNAEQVIKQIQEYETQLQQYEDQLKNTLAPAAYIWDQAQSTIDNLMSATDTLNYYKTQLGSIDSYLSKFGDVTYYRGSPCYSAEGCSDAERAVMEENRILASESQKKANDALFRGLDRQQDALKADSRRLEQLQAAAQTATGRMEAIQFANQLASQQANQLLQIRGLLIAQQNAIATRMQAEADLEARQLAAHAISTESRIDWTANPKNWLDMTR